MKCLIYAPSGQNDKCLLLYRLIRSTKKSIVQLCMYFREIVETIQALKVLCAYLWIRRYFFNTFERHFRRNNAICPLLAMHMWPCRFQGLYLISRHECLNAVMFSAFIDADEFMVATCYTELLHFKPNLIKTVDNM